ncbi:hypothetical protein GDO81_006701 [Engystomops pustulosus]|uniref:Uncharacterized protein n=1 Tax=Engystomops pustulosus TaxID=76066 RepID=A0AAV7CYQ6_ENGPU|nr:hypothetical protein GDO81_006701 [Engystomops pustulosus]
MQVSWGVEHAVHAAGGGGDVCVLLSDHVICCISLGHGWHVVMLLLQGLDTLEKGRLLGILALTTYRLH